jgi:hypothetical protein
MFVHGIYLSTKRLQVLLIFDNKPAPIIIPKVNALTITKKPDRIIKSNRSFFLDTAPNGGRDMMMNHLPTSENSRLQKLCPRALRIKQRPTKFEIRNFVQIR